MLWFSLALAFFARSGENHAPIVHFHGVAVSEDRHEEPRRVQASALEDLAEQKQNGDAVEDSHYWIWTAECPPGRLSTKQLSEGFECGGARTLHVKISATRPLKQKMKLWAAPISMWEEVPETVLPSWEVGTTKVVNIPVDGTSPWRLRVAGDGLGSWWVDVPPRASTAQLIVTTAQDRGFVVESEEGGVLESARLSVLDAGAHRGRFRKLADYRSGETGQIFIQSLPDAAATTLFVAAREHPPFVIEGHMTALPQRIQLSKGSVLTGTLTDDDGSPVEGASVVVRGWASERVPLPVARAHTSDENGRWKIEALPAGEGFWRVQAEGFAESSGRVVLGEEEDLGVVVLHPQIDVTVQVVDDRQEPIAAAVIDLLGEELGRTDDQGVATIGAGGTQHLEIGVSAPAHRRASATITPPFDDPVVVKLDRAFRVEGRVVNDGGEALSAGIVRAYRSSSFERTELEPGGRFVFDLRPGIEYRLELLSPQAEPRTLEIGTGDPGEFRDLGDLVLSTGISVQGRLVRDGDGAPIANARIWLPRPSESGALMAWALRDTLEAVSGVDGRFLLSGLQTASAVLRVEASGFAPMRIPITPEPDVTRLDVGDVGMAEGVEVTVRVSASDGAASEAKIDYVGHGLPMDILTAPITGGVATFSNVPSGRVIVSAWKGEDVVCRKEAEVPEDRQRIELVCVAKKVQVSGEVRVGGRSSGPGTIVWITPADPELPTGVFEFSNGGLVQQQMFAGDFRRVVAEVGFDGHFRGAEVPPGAWEVLFIPEAGQAMGPRPLQLSDEISRHHIVLEFPGASVSGVVLDQDRQPVAGAQIRELSGQAFSTSREDGSFNLSGANPGLWKMQARAAGKSSAVIELRVEEGNPPGPVELILDPNEGVIRVTLGQHEAGGAVVFMETNGGRIQLSSVDSQGIAEFRLPAPLPGRIRSAAMANGRWRLGKWIDVPMAIDHGIVLEPQATGAASLTSDGPEGPVKITRSDGWQIDRLLHWIGGAPLLETHIPLVIHGLPAGTYEFGVGAQRKIATLTVNQVEELGFE